jgi:ABC-type transporter Mla subunit MlaD
LTVAADINQLLATIKGIEAQLSTMALNTNIPEASKIFHETMLVIGEIKTDLQDRRTQIEKEEPQYKS